MKIRARVRRWLGRKIRRSFFVVRALLDKRSHEDFCRDYLRRRGR